MCLLPSPFGQCHKWWKPRGVSSCRQRGWIPGEGKGSRQETRSGERRWNDGVFLVLWCTGYRRLPAPSYVPPKVNTPLLTRGHPAGQGRWQLSLSCPSVCCRHCWARLSNQAPWVMCTEHQSFFNNGLQSLNLISRCCVCVCVCVCVYVSAWDWNLAFFLDYIQWHVGS